MSSLTNHLLHSFYFMSDEDISKSLALEIGSQSSNQIISNPNVESKFQSYTNLNDCKNDECLNKAESSPKRKYFTKEEDELLREAALMYGERSWSLIAECVPGKTPKQCRDRWMNYLQPSLNNTPWTEQEDQLLVSLVNIHGTHWTKMKTNFPKRSSNCIKNRWYWLIKNKPKNFPKKKKKNYNRIKMEKNLGIEKNVFIKNCYINDEYQKKFAWTNSTSDNSFFQSKNQSCNIENNAKNKICFSDNDFGTMNNNNMQNINNVFNIETNYFNDNDFKLAEFVSDDFFYEFI